MDSSKATQSKSRKKQPLSKEEKQRRNRRRQREEGENGQDSVGAGIDEHQRTLSRPPPRPTGPKEEELTRRSDNMFHLDDEGVQNYVLSIRLKECMYTIERVETPTHKQYKQQTTTEVIRGNCTVRQAQLYTRTVIELTNALLLEEITAENLEWATKFWNMLSDLMEPTATALASSIGLGKRGATKDDTNANEGKRNKGKRDEDKDKEEEEEEDGQQEEKDAGESVQDLLSNVSQFINKEMSSTHSELRKLTVETWEKHWPYMSQTYRSAVNGITNMGMQSTFASMQELEDHFNSLINHTLKLNWVLGTHSNICRAILLLLELSFLFIIHLHENSDDDDDNDGSGKAKALVTVDAFKKELFGSAAAAGAAGGAGGTDLELGQSSVIKRYALNQLQRLLITPNPTYAVRMAKHIGDRNLTHTVKPLDFDGSQAITPNVLSVLEHSIVRTLLKAAKEKTLQIQPPLSQVFQKKSYHYGAIGDIENIYAHYLHSTNAPMRQLIDKATDLQQLDFCFIMSATHKDYAARLQVFLQSLLRFVQGKMGRGADYETVKRFSRDFEELYQEILFPPLRTDDTHNPNLFTTITMQKMRSIFNAVRLTLRNFNSELVKTTGPVVSRYIETLILRMG